MILFLKQSSEKATIEEANYIMTEMMDAETIQSIVAIIKLFIMDTKAMTYGRVYS